MSTGVKSALRLMGTYFRLNLSAAMEYRANFLLQVFGMALNNASFIVFWSILFARVDRVGDYGFQEVMFVWALSSAAFGVAHILFGNISQLSSMIMQGDLDTYLVQPKDVCLNVVCSRTIVSAWGDLAYGLVLYLAVYGFSLSQFVLFLLFSVLGGVLMGSVILSAESLAFFFGNSSAVGRLVREFLITFSLYPDSIYQGAVRWVIYSIIPAGFIVFIPYRIMSAFSWPCLVGLATFDVVYTALAYLLFNAGLRRYESGNLIGFRM